MFGDEMKINGNKHRWLKKLFPFLLICIFIFVLGGVVAQTIDHLGIDKSAGGVYQKGQPVIINWKTQDSVESLRLRAKDPQGMEFISQEFPGGTPETIVKNYELNPIEQHPNKSRAPVGTYKIDLEENYKRADTGETYQKRYGLDFFYAQAIGYLSIEKFNDENGDGIRQSDEVGLPGWKFAVSGPNGFERTFFTDENGLVTKIDGPAGDYVVRETLQPEWESSTPAVQHAKVSEKNLTSISFGNMQIRGNLTIIKYLDANRNGAKEPDEQGLSGWEFSIVGEGINKKVSTGSDGTARLEKMRPGSYTVTETRKAGWLSKTPAQQSVTIAGRDNKVVTFGNYVNFGSFTIIAFEDRNINGVLDKDQNGLPKEPGLAGWDIVIGFPDGTNKTFQTYANGLIPNIQLPSGSYRVEEILKPGWISTTKTEQRLELAPGGNRSVEFGNYRPGIVTKFWDRNSNGKRDSGEPGLSGWTFKISGPSGSTSKTTDADGNIVLTGLSAGKYTVEEVISSDKDWYNTTPIVASLDLPGGSLSFGNDKYRTLKVFKFNDLNINGKYDGTESGLEDWEFQVSGIPGQALTNSQGVATFKAKANKRYLVSESLPVNWLNSTPLEVDVQIDPAKNVTEVMFGDYYYIPQPIAKKAVIAIHAFNDTNRNGKFDPGEPGLSNMEIRISNLNNPSSTYDSITTNSNGDIEYNCTAGTYWVEQILFSNWCTNGDIASRVAVQANGRETVNFGSYPCVFGNCEYRYTPPQGNFSSGVEDENLLIKKSVDPYVLSMPDHDMVKGALINYTITICAKPKIGPTDLILAVDTSGSVIESNKAALNEINRGVSGFVEAMKKSQNSNLRIGLVSWDSNIDETIKPTLDYNEIINASGKLRANPQELTMYQVGMNGSLDAFDAAPREGARKVIVFITDAKNEYEPFLKYPDPAKYTIYVLLLNKPQVNETYDMLNKTANRFNGKLVEVDDSSQITSTLTSLSQTSLVATGAVNDIKIVDTLPTYLRPINNGTKPGVSHENKDGVNWKTNSLAWSIPSLQYGKCWSTTFTAVFCWKLQANVAQPANSRPSATSQVDYADPAKTGRKIISLPEGTIWIESDAEAPKASKENAKGAEGSTEQKMSPGIEPLLCLIGFLSVAYLLRKK